MLCTGRGFNPCAVCGGVGATMLSKSRMGVGGRLEFYQERVACTLCFGTGRVMCQACRGVGWVLTGDTPAGPEGRPPHPNPPAQNPEPLPAASTPSEPFAFRDYQFVYHPVQGDVWACWQHNPGNVLDAGSATASVTRIDLAMCQHGVWLQVRTNNGEMLPLSIFVGAGELRGRWL